MLLPNYDLFIHTQQLLESFPEKFNYKVQWVCATKYGFSKTVCFAQSLSPEFIVEYSVDEWVEG